MEGHGGYDEYGELRIEMRGARKNCEWKRERDRRKLAADYNIGESTFIKQ